MHECRDSGYRGLKLYSCLDFFVCLFVLRQGFSVYPWLSWNPLCRLGWPETQRSTYLCFPSAGTNGAHHDYLAC